MYTKISLKSNVVLKMTFWINKKIHTYTPPGLAAGGPGGRLPSSALPWFGWTWRLASCKEDALFNILTIGNGRTGNVLICAMRLALLKIVCSCSISGSRYSMRNSSTVSSSNTLDNSVRKARARLCRSFNDICTLSTTWSRYQADE